jgi:hypothetical protein
MHYKKQPRKHKNAHSARFVQKCAELVRDAHFGDLEVQVPQKSNPSF